MEHNLKTSRYSVGISNRSRVKKPIIINCNICDTLTPMSCSKIITEIAKYILCSRLIPYPYYALKNAARNFNCWSLEKLAHLQKRKAVQMKRHHTKVVEAYNNFESIFQNIQLELLSCAACDDVVEEVVLLIGATSRSPREVYRIVVPPISCVETDQKQSESRILLNLIRCIVLSEGMEDMLDHSISPTNMYVMLKKKQGRQSEWFVPKDSYSLPFCGRQAIIILSEQVEQQVDSDTFCKKTTQSKPADVPVDTETQQSPLLEFNNLHIVPKSMQWFQSRVCLKGFKHCKNSGLSVGSSLKTEHNST